MEQITYNKYGNVKLPDEITESFKQIWSIIEPYLITLTVLQIRALMSDINLEFTNDFCAYILRRQMEQRKQENNKKSNDDF